jgi:small basic protein
MRCRLEENPMHKNLIVSLAVAATVIVAVPALGAPKMTTGMIASIDAAAGTVTLTTGDTFKLPMEIKTTALNVGAAVRITYDTDPMGLLVASDVLTIDDQQTRPPAPSPTSPPAQGGAG